MPKLMKWLSQWPLPGLNPVHDEQLVFQTIRSACMTASIATNLLLRHGRKRNTHLAALRANPLYVFSQDAYPVIEWRETDNSRNIAIFYVEDQKECVQCRLSWLMLSVTNTAENQEKPRLNWSVSHVSHIRLLFNLAQHLFGVLQWSNEDKLDLYCLRKCGDCQPSE